VSTLEELIQWGVKQAETTDLYYGHGTESAWEDMLALALHGIDKSYDDLPNVLNKKLSPHEKGHIQECMKRRIKDQEPVPYITKQAWFAGLPFYVDERVIIPRSPIAELIEADFSPWIPQQNVRSILDLCTGSGCIAIACALQFPDVDIHGSDISKEALAVAEINVQHYDVAAQVTLLQSDLLTELPPQKYDIIVSNPPYVDKEDMDSLPKEYHYEPVLALASGIDGLTHVRRILKTAMDYLSPQGILIVEVGNSQEALVQRYPTVPFLWLEFSRGGDGVFLLTYEQLLHSQSGVPG